ncbi:UNVERIFIED_CONTAM: hypothetical protein RMT77_018271 [Armadillidium vulgare]
MFSNSSSIPVTLTTIPESISYLESNKILQESESSVRKTISQTRKSKYSPKPTESKPISVKPLTELKPVKKLKPSKSNEKMTGPSPQPVKKLPPSKPIEDFTSPPLKPVKNLPPSKSNKNRTGSTPTNHSSKKIEEIEGQKYTPTLVGKPLTLPCITISSGIYKTSKPFSKQFPEVTDDSQSGITISASKEKSTLKLTKSLELLKRNPLFTSHSSRSSRKFTNISDILPSPPATTSTISIKKSSNVVAPTRRTWSNADHKLTRSTGSCSSKYSSSSGSTDNYPSEFSTNNTHMSSQVKSLNNRNNFVIPELEFKSDVISYSERPEKGFKHRNESFKLKPSILKETFDKKFPTILKDTEHPLPKSSSIVSNFHNANTSSISCTRFQDSNLPRKICESISYSIPLSFVSNFHDENTSSLSCTSLQDSNLPQKICESISYSMPLIINNSSITNRNCNYANEISNIPTTINTTVKSNKELSANKRVNKLDPKISRDYYQQFSDLVDDLEKQTPLPVPETSNSNSILNDNKIFVYDSRTSPVLINNNDEATCVTLDSLYELLLDIRQEMEKLRKIQEQILNEYTSISFNSTKNKLEYADERSTPDSEALVIDLGNEYDSSENNVKISTNYSQPTEDMSRKRPAEPLMESTKSKFIVKFLTSEGGMDFLENYQSYNSLEITNSPKKLKTNIAKNEWHETCPSENDLQKDKGMDINYSTRTSRFGKSLGISNSKADTEVIEISKSVLNNIEPHPIRLSAQDTHSECTSISANNSNNSDCPEEMYSKEGYKNQRKLASDTKDRNSLRRLLKAKFTNDIKVLLQKALREELIQYSQDRERRRYLKQYLNDLKKMDNLSINTVKNYQNMQALQPRIIIPSLSNESNSAMEFQKQQNILQAPALHSSSSFKPSAPFLQSESYTLPSTVNRSAFSSNQNHNYWQNENRVRTVETEPTRESITTETSAFSSPTKPFLHNNLRYNLYQHVGYQPIIHQEKNVQSDTMTIPQHSEVPCESVLNQNQCYDPLSYVSQNQMSQCPLACRVIPQNYSHASNLIPPSYISQHYNMIDQVPEAFCHFEQSRNCNPNII